MENPPKKLKMSKNVVLLGWVSFFNDIASEMIYPVVPIFLTTVLGAPVVAVGLIEGVAESTASFLKVVSGWFSDKFKRRKPFVVLGYSLSTFAKIIFGFAYHWPTVFVGRFVDRLGKGTRTSARDALIADSTDPAIRGKAFGLHRSLDTLGAVVGPIVALIFLAGVSQNLRLIFFFAFIPSLIGILLLVFFIKDVPKENTKAQKPKFRFSQLSPSFKIFLLISVVFAIGNSSDAFLILRAKDLGMSNFLTIFTYVLFNITYALFSLPAGILSDKIGFRKVLIVGFLIFALVYFGFGIIQTSWLVWLLFLIYGFYMAFTDGVGKAYISKIVPPEQMGTCLGIYQTATGICVLFASLIAGALWTYVNPQITFFYGAFLAIISILLFIWLERQARRGGLSSP